MVSLLRLCMFGLVWLFLLTGVGSAQSPDPVSIEVEPSVGSLNDTFSASVVFDATKVKGSVFLLPSSDFEVRGRSTQSSQQIINGNISVTLSYQFQITPKHTGKLTTPTARVQFVDGTIKDYPGQVVEVMQGDPTDDAVLADVRFRQSVDQLKVYQGQQLFHSLEVQSWVNLDALSITQPDYSDFWVHPFDKTNSVVRTDNRGDRYQVYALNRALFPQKAGTLHLAKATLKADALTPKRNRGGFGGAMFGGLTGMPDIDVLMGGLERTPVEVDANDLDIEVLPLPPRPSNFSDWGLLETLVGSVELSVDVGTTKIKTGESKTLTYRIVSTANAAGIKRLPLNLGSSVKQYDEDVISKQVVRGKEVLTQIIIPVTIVPLRPGTVEIPALDLSYFNPQTESYQVASSAPISFTVTGKSLADSQEPADDSQGSPSKGIDVSTKSIATTEAEVTDDKAMAYKDPSWREWLQEQLSLSIILAFILTTLAVSGCVRLLMMKRRKQRPIRLAIAKLRASESEEALFTGFMSFLTVFFNSKGIHFSQNCSRLELKKLMAEAGLGDATCFQIDRTLDEFERARYGGVYEAQDLDSLRVLATSSVEALGYR